MLTGKYLHVEKSPSTTVDGIVITELSEWEVTVDAEGLATKKRTRTSFLLTGDSGRFGGDPFDYWDDADDAARLLANEHNGDIEWYRKYFTRERDAEWNEFQGTVLDLSQTKGREQLAALAESPVVPRAGHML